ncbi:hypothetical protein V8C43DRAFT_288675 [Trichoderma afarasin]
MEAITIVVLLLSLLLQPLASACCNTSPGALASRITLRHQRNIKCNIRHQLFACSLCFAQIPFLPSTLSLATLPPSSSCSQAPSQTQNTLASSSFPRLAAPIRQFAIAVLLDGGAAPPPSACR